MEAYLPDYCYSKKTIKHEYIIIHFFSCLYVQPDDPFDTFSCQMLMHDLNVEPKYRMKFPMQEQPDRGWASAHCMIARTGFTLLMVPRYNKAYHAGTSFYLGRSNFNEFSYGIEMIGHLTSGFEQKQYEACALECVSVMKEFNIPMSNILGHEQIAPGRKTDPGIANGNFHMDKLKELIGALL